MIKQQFPIDQLSTESTAEIAVNIAVRGHQTDYSAPLTLLSKVRAGQRVKIASVEGSCSEISRLAEMGLRRGVEIIALRSGTTSILRVNRSLLCLRLGSETTVRVQLIG